MENDRALTPDSNAIPAKDEASPEWFVCDDGVVHLSFDLIPQEALDYIRQKALDIAGVEAGRVIEQVKEALQEAIKNGMTLDEFRRQVNFEFDKLGVTRLSSHHLDTVYRTNVFSAYAIGQMQQIDSMSDRFPLWRYSAIKDNRTRPDHRALDGNIYRTGQGPLPPIDYNCRCTAQYLHVSQVEKQGLEPRDWTGNDQLVQFDVRASFEEWKAANSSVITPGIASALSNI